MLSAENMSVREVVAKSLPKSVKFLLKATIATTRKFSDKKFRFRRASSLTAEDFKFWHENGYFVLDNFFNPERLERINTLIAQIWQNRANDSNNPLVVDIFTGTDQARRILLKDAPDDARTIPYKLNDLFLELEEVRNLILDLELCQVLNDLLEGEPMVCNSLSFERGSQQGFHFDTFYMPPVVPNKMLATWIALEDCSLDAGPLTYYPGSHKIEPYYFSDGKLNAIQEEMPLCESYIQQQVEKYNLKPKKFSAKAGDVFIWHAQLLHGGSEIKNMNLTRKSIVTHYFRINEHPRDYITIGNYRHYMKRSHQNVPSSCGEQRQ